MKTNSSTPRDASFQPFRDLMRGKGLPDVFVAAFEHGHRRLVSGETGLVPEREIAPVQDAVDSSAFGLSETRVGIEALAKTVMVKVNGGLGTSMGLTKAKSLLPVRDGLSFLDIVARQALTGGFRLLFMNSFSTHEDTLAALSGYGLEQGGALPLGFVQHQAPKIRRSDLSPVSFPQNPDLEWYPPGHGDLYASLATRGILEKLVQEGIEYLFVSNADNLGGVVDPKILGYFVQSRLPFLMEVADRTPADRKGGHVARRLQTGRLMLRETAQCPPDGLEQFQDVSRHRFFNTNNLWMRVSALAREIDNSGGFLRLPIIRNEKTVDPKDASTIPVYQLETAMGAALELFDGAEVVRVSRRRFAPVKTTSDLLLVRSDLFRLDENHCIVPAQETGSVAEVDLDPRYYGFASQLDRLFPFGPPRLAGCTRFSVRGAVRFGRGVEAMGDVHIVSEGDDVRQVSDGRSVEGVVRLG